MAYTVTRKQVGDQLDFLITIWRENMKKALDNAKDPRISGNTFLKNMSWLNVGKDAISAFYPNSNTGQLIKALTTEAKFAPPVFIMSQAATAFDAAYSAYIASHNKILTSRFTDIRTKLFSSIDSASVAFKATAYGQSIVRKVMNHLARVQFERPADLDVFVRLFILQSKLVVTDQTELASRVSKGYGQLCKTIYELYLGSRRGPGTNRMWLDTGKMVVDGYGIHSVKHIVRSKAEQDKMIAEAWKWNTHHVDRWWLSKKPDETWATRNKKKKPARLAITYIGPNFPAQLAWKAAMTEFRKQTGRTPSIVKAGTAPAEVNRPQSKSRGGAKSAGARVLEGAK